MMRPAARLAVVLLWAATCTHAGSQDPLSFPGDIDTHPDGRLPVAALLERYRPLLEAGWVAETIASSQPEGTAAALPIVALRTREEGPAAWFITGIHGEETAGPNALAQSVDALLDLGRRLPVVVVPLANPWGYARNWRYLNLPEWSEQQEAHSVGDASHWLPDPQRPLAARAQRASSPEAGAFTAWVLERSRSHPPRWSIDLHEDNLIDRGYVYSQGVEGAGDPLATFAVSVLRKAGIAVQMAGETRFGETIEGGIIGPVVDSSVDELISAGVVIGPEGPRSGPGAHTVLVFETPAAALPLERRVAAHRALVEALAARLEP